jgi:signal transduction histidine kinase
MVARIDEGQAAYIASRRLVVGFALGAIALALGLGYSISRSLINPVRQMEARFGEIAAGDFSRRLEVRNRDELGALADNLNRMSAELGRLYRQVEIANRNKSEFLANMSHELRTPLNAIIGFSEVLIEQMFGEVNDKQLEYLKDIHSSGHHLLSLINDILDLSKIEAGRMELELSSFDLPELLDNCLMLVRERAARHGLALALEVQEGLGDWVADERKVKQVVINLLSNAVKFTPEGGNVSLRARRLDAAGESAAVEVAVVDTGVGIAAAEQALVFEEFRQASGEHLRKSEGTGLGLALAKRFVELHGGAMRLESAVGRGSTFAFTLPKRTIDIA